MKATAVWLRWLTLAIIAILYFIYVGPEEDDE